jgi:DNA-directed RNA polymerase specialized sigma24 family protein
MSLATYSVVSDVELFDLNSESSWKKLYPLLVSFVRRLVSASNVASWRGQERDIVEDIVQETCRRIIEYSQKTERGEALPIQSLKSMLFAVAHNYCQDLRRRDCRLLRMEQQDALVQAYLDQRAQINLAEAGVENVYQEALFRLIAHEVAAFPHKQRRAILIDLARRMHFGKQPTALQQAFLEAGINLREYRQALPSNPQEKNRHIALVSYAYKRIASLPCVQQYIAFT